MQRKLGTVTIGDAFIYTRDPKVNKPTGFEGELLEVVRFKRPSYKNRVVLRRPNGQEVLFPIGLVKQAQDRAGQGVTINDGGEPGHKSMP